MTYTPPEGATIGSFTADTLPATFRAPADAVISYKIYGTSAGAGVETESGEPAGYKIPILNTSGVTENLWDGTVTEWKNAALTITKNQDNSFTVSRQSSSTASYFPAITITSNLITGKKYSLAFKITGLTQEMIDTHPVAGVRNTDSNTFISGSYTVLNQNGTYETPITEIPTDFSENYEYCILLVSNATFAFSNITISDIVISERFQSNYDLFIGSTKLGAEEYVDYAEQKIYKMSGSTLVPTDPPVPFPPIPTYEGENTLSSTETLGDVEFAGDWLAIMGSTEDESIDIEFTVDAEEYIASVTVDDDPQIQVSDTITMPSSADSFTLEVVSWGRERYTETVYNALS